MLRKGTALLLISIMLIFSLTGCSAAAKAEYDLERIKPDVISGMNDFAFRIFRQLSSEDAEESIFISPLSISSALTMTYNGAEGRTKEAMSKALGFIDMERASVNEGYRNLNDYLSQMDKDIELNIGNSIWIREGEEVKEEFIKENEDTFKAEVDMLDFSDEDAADTINGWISDATKGKIDRMLAPPIPADVIMYLINAIYFKGEWSNKFDPDKTYEGDFTAADKTIQTVDMMRRTGKVEYAEGDFGKAVRLPYGKGSTSMLILLPEEGTDINGWIDMLTPEKLREIRNSINETEDVRLIIPRFKLEYGIKNLNDSLSALGMEEAFSYEADFSGIEEEIFISRVLHKAVIEVNEKGSEAAASTLVEMQKTAAREPITFIADRPFAFLITEDTTGAILFMGKVMEINR